MGLFDSGVCGFAAVIVLLLYAVQIELRLLGSCRNIPITPIDRIVSVIADSPVNSGSPR